MASYIPFVNRKLDAELVRRHYSNARLIRVPLAAGLDSTKKQLPSEVPLWVDPRAEVFHSWPMNVDPKTQKFFKGFKHADDIGDTGFQKRPERDAVRDFVLGVLDKCNSVKPAWLSVPQLPLLDGGGRNKINRQLAEASADWYSRSGFKGRFILPVIFTNQRQLNSKTTRNTKLEQVLKCYSLAKAQGVWVVDPTLADDAGSSTLDKRFKGLISMHEELKAKVPMSSLFVGGPYWGLNLVLWVRGLVTNPAVGVTSFQYSLPRSSVFSHSERIALSPLRRRAHVNSLDRWLRDALGVIEKSNPAHSELKRLLKLIDVAVPARNYDYDQIADMYSSWLDRLERFPAPGRALALYQDLSSAFVLGRSLPDLPKKERTARKPERVAQQLMLHCL